MGQAAGFAVNKMRWIMESMLCLTSLDVVNCCHYLDPAAAVRLKDGVRQHVFVGHWLRGSEFLCFVRAAEGITSAKPRLLHWLVSRGMRPLCTYINGWIDVCHNVL